MIKDDGELDVNFSPILPGTHIVAITDGKTTSEIPIQVELVKAIVGIPASVSLPLEILSTVPQEKLDVFVKDPTENQIPSQFLHKDTGKDGPIMLSPLKATDGKLPVISQPAEPIRISKKLKKGTDSEIMFTPVKWSTHS